jgi:hypothetical protein
VIEVAQFKFRFLNVRQIRLRHWSVAPSHHYWLVFSFLLSWPHFLRLLQRGINRGNAFFASHVWIAGRSRSYKCTPCYLQALRSVNRPCSKTVGYLITSILPGPNPTIASCNASAVKIYNATSSLVRFENKNIFFATNKRYSLQQRWRRSCKFKSRRIGSR